MEKQRSTVPDVFNAIQTQSSALLATLSRKIKPYFYFRLPFQRFRLLPSAHLSFFQSWPAGQGWKLNNKTLEQFFHGKRPTYTTTTTNRSQTWGVGVATELRNLIFAYFKREMKMILTSSVLVVTF